MAPKGTRVADAKAEAAGKSAKPAKYENQLMLVGEDTTPQETKASIQRMLAFLKYRADPNKNKSGEGLTEASTILEANMLQHFQFGQAYRKIADKDRKSFSSTTPSLV